MTNIDLPNKPHTSDNKLKSNTTKKLSKIENIKPKSKPAINRTHGDENIFALVNNSSENHRALIRHYNPEEEKVDNINKKNLKGPTPRATDINSLKPKINKNHIKDNRLSIINQDVPLKVTMTKEDIKLTDPIHRDFGKTPEYLKKYKRDAEEKKEYEKKLAEEAKYPKGTKLLSENERLETLNQLVDSRKDVITLLEKLPISLKTMSLQNRKTELERKLDELDDAIRTFSRKQVFIKVDQ